MPDNNGLVRTVKLRIAIKNNSDQTLIRTITRLLLLVRNKDVQFFERQERYRTKFGCESGTRRFEGSQIKVPKQLTLLRH